MRRFPACLSALLACVVWCAAAQAQYSRIDAPFGSIGNSFYESIGVSWGLQGNGWFARFGGPPVMPPFGSFDPAAQGQFGAGFRGGGVSGFLNFSAGQGSDSFMGSQTPSVVLPNGGFGFVSDTLQRPFVLGIVPVLGSEPVSPVKEALSRLEADGGLPRLGRDEESEEGLNLGGKPAAAGASSGATGGKSTAERGDLSIAEIRARQAAEDAAAAAEIDALVEKAAQSESAGKLGLARIYYRQAVRRASGIRKSELEAKLQAIDEQLKAPSDR
jgi:hypothetical protein